MSVSYWQCSACWSTLVYYSEAANESAIDTPGAIATKFMRLRNDSESVLGAVQLDMSCAHIDGRHQVGQLTGDG